MLIYAYCAGILACLRRGILEAGQTANRFFDAPSLLCNKIWVICYYTKS